MDFEQLCRISPVLESICSHLSFKEAIILKDALKRDTLPYCTYLTERCGSRKLLITEINPVTIRLQKELKNGSFDLGLKFLCMHGKLSEVQILLQCSFSKEALTQAFIYASTSQNERLLSILLDRGADINGINSFQETALIRACQHGYLSTVQFLLERGADVNLLDSDENDAFYRAVNHGDLDIIKLLLATGKITNIRSALSNAIITNRLEIVKLLVDTRINLNARDRNGVNPLINAVYQCQPLTVAYLLEKGVNVQKPNLNGWTPLEIARKRIANDQLKSKKKTGFLRIIELLEKSIE